MSDRTEHQFEETVSCDVAQDEGLLHIEIITMPYADPVEFDTARARRLAREILRGVAVVEEGWVGGAPGREVSIQAAGNTLAPALAVLRDLGFDVSVSQASQG